jgi:hypothetical protein
LRKLHSWLDFFKVLLLDLIRVGILMDLFKLEEWLLNDRLLQDNAIIIKKAWSFLFKLNRLSSLRFHGLKLNKNVAPNLLTKAVVLTAHESKESIVASWSDWSLKIQSYINFLIRENWSLDLKRLSLKIISIGLNEEGIFRPFGLSSISEGPSLSKGLASEDRETFSKAFFNKSCHMVDSFFLRFPVQFPWGRLVHRWIDRLIHELAIILRLALDEDWSVFRSSDLKEKMGMRLLSFALFA